MSNKQFKVFSWAMAALWLASMAWTVFAQEELPIPQALRLVDQSNVLTEQQHAALTAKLKAATDRVVIGVIIVPTTMPEDIFTYSMRTFDAWKLGGKGKDNGVLITIATVDRKVRITTGIGTEGKLTDADTVHIIGHMKPALKKADYYAALNTAIERIHYQLAPETIAPVPILQSSQVEPDMTSFLGWVFGSVLVLFGGICFIRMMNKREDKKVEEEIIRQKKAVNRQAAARDVANASHSAKVLRESRNLRRSPVAIPRHERRTPYVSPARKSSGDFITGMAAGVLVDEIIHRTGSSHSSSDSSSSSGSGDSDSSYSSSDTGGSSSGGGSDDSF